MAVKTNRPTKKTAPDGDNAKVAADWLKRADEHLIGARLLLNRPMPGGAVPSAHFAIQAAVRAVLRSKGVKLKDPRSALSVFNKRVVKPGHFSFDLMAHAETVAKIRELADYYELAPIPKVQARYALAAAAKFVAAVEKFLKEKKTVNEKPKKRITR